MRQLQSQTRRRKWQTKRTEKSERVLCDARILSRTPRCYSHFHSKSMQRTRPQPSGQSVVHALEPPCAVLSRHQVPPSGLGATG